MSHLSESLLPSLVEECCQLLQEVILSAESWYYAIECGRTCRCHSGCGHEVTASSAVALVQPRIVFIKDDHVIIYSDNIYIAVTMHVGPGVSSDWPRRAHTLSREMEASCAILVVTEEDKIGVQYVQCQWIGVPEVNRSDKTIDVVIIR